MLVREILDAKGAEVLTVFPEDGVTLAAALMAKRQIGVLVCCDDAGTIAGVISERDIVQAVAARAGETEALSVGDLMSRGPHTCRAEDSVAQVFAEMSRGRFRHMPVVDDDGELTGLISATDILRHCVAPSDPPESERLLVAFVNAFAAPRG